VYLPVEAVDQPTFSTITQVSMGKSDVRFYYIPHTVFSHTDSVQMIQFIAWKMAAMWGILGCGCSEVFLHDSFAMSAARLNCH